MKDLNKKIDPKMTDKGIEQLSISENSKVQCPKKPSKHRVVLNPFSYSLFFIIKNLDIILVSSALVSLLTIGIILICNPATLIAGSILTACAGIVGIGLGLKRFGIFSSKADALNTASLEVSKSESEPFSSVQGDCIII